MWSVQPQHEAPVEHLVPLLREHPFSLREVIHYIWSHRESTIKYRNVCPTVIACEK
jgi:hypothetical protein